MPAGTYNLGSGRSLTVLQLAELVQDAAEAQHGDAPGAARRRARATEPVAPYVVDTGRLARRRTGVPSTPIGDAIAETVRFCLDHRADLENRT